MLFRYPDGQLQYKKIADFVDEDSSDAFSPESVFNNQQTSPPQQQLQSVESVLFQINNSNQVCVTSSPMTSPMSVVTSQIQQPPSSSPNADRTTSYNITQVSKLSRESALLRFIYLSNSEYTVKNFVFSFLL